MPMSRETKETNHISTMGGNYKRNPKPENIELKTSADVQPIRKSPSRQWTNNSRNKETSRSIYKGKQHIPKTVDNPPLAQRHIPFCPSRRGTQEPAGQSHSTTPHTSSKVEGPYRLGEGQAVIPSGRSITEPALSRYVTCSWVSRDSQREILRYYEAREEKRWWKSLQEI